MNHLQTNGKLELYSATLGPTFSNTYFIVDKLNKCCLLIDPALDSEIYIESVLNSSECELNGVLCTHGHFDHVGSSAFFQKKYGCDVFLDQDDLKVVKKSKFLMYMIGVSAKFEQPSFKELADAQKIFNIPSLCTLKAPGHTPGSCIIKIGPWWFTGDTIYSRGIGLSNLPGEDKMVLKSSILSIIEQIGGDDYIFPGHGPSIKFSELLKTNVKLNEFLYA